MDGWQVAASIAQIAQAIVVSLTLYFIWHQVKQQTVQAQQQTRQVTLQAKLAKAANAQALVDISSPYNILFAQDEKVAKLWLKGPTNFKTFSEVERFQYKRTLIWHLIFFENIFLQNEMGLLDDYMYRAWDAALKRFVELHNLNEHWREFKSSYHPDFCRRVEELINAAARPSGEPA